MSKTRGKTGSRGGHQRRISVRAARRESPDLRTLGRAIVAIALAQAEAESEALAEASVTPDADSPTSPSSSTGSAAASEAHHA